MSATGYLRGHAIYYDGEEWRYSDTGQPTVGNRRACGHCNQPDTPEGHDPCIGTLPGVVNACCGHGQADEAYVMYADGRVVGGEDALGFFDVGGGND